MIAKPSRIYSLQAVPSGPTASTPGQLAGGISVYAGDDLVELRLVHGDLAVAGKDGIVQSAHVLQLDQAFTVFSVIHTIAQIHDDMFTLDHVAGEQGALGAIEQGDVAVDMTGGQNHFKGAAA